MQPAILESLQLIITIGFSTLSRDLIPRAP